MQGDSGFVGDAHSDAIPNECDHAGGACNCDWHYCECNASQCKCMNVVYNMQQNRCDRCKAGKHKRRWFYDGTKGKEK
jgi:hypothetical protein